MHTNIEIKYRKIGYFMLTCIAIKEREKNPKVCFRILDLNIKLQNYIKIHIQEVQHKCHLAFSDTLAHDFLNAVAIRNHTYQITIAVILKS